jgi:uncharacterized protein
MRTSHRPLPLPQGSWIMTQTWNHVLFAHWKVPLETLEKQVPNNLEIDTYQGEGWISILPFYLSLFRPRYLPPAPGMHAFPELNLRTYVTVDGQPGIYFFSMDASHLLAVLGARTFFHLPYYHADMKFQKKEVSYQLSSQRKNNEKANFEATYKPSSVASSAKSESLDYWLVERYRLYTTFNDQLFYQDIHHKPWMLQQVDAQISSNGLPSTHCIDLSDQPQKLHYAKKQKVLFWPIRKWNYGK